MREMREKVYNAFDPSPLRADLAENDSLYVCLDSVRGDGKVVDRLAEKIRLAGDFTCQILAGHKGSGKSTELRCLKRKLETGDKRFFVVFCDSDNDIDRNDVDFFEVLISVVRQTVVQLHEKTNIELQPGYFRDRWERIWSLLSSKIGFDKIDLEAGLATISTTIKSSPDTRIKLRDSIESDTGNWLAAANDLIGKAILDLRKLGFFGLVILIDGLDKLAPRHLPDHNCSLAERLFIRREAQLTAFKCHTVYTMPLALAYSTQEPTIANLYGGAVPVLPMIRISNPPEEGGGDYEPGITKCRDIIQRRLQSCGANTEQVFDSDDTRDYLIRYTGGQPTELMYFTREALITSFPIDKAAVERPIRERRRAYLRQLRAEHWPVIEQVRQTGNFERSEENEQVIRDLLDGRAILQYSNGGDWYGVNPVIPESTKTERA